MFTRNNLKGPTYLHCIYVVALVVMSIILRHKNCIFLSTCCVKHWGFNSQQERMVPDNTALKASTEDKQAVPIKGDKHREARSTACNGNTQEEQGICRGDHKAFMKEVTFSLRHKASRM